MPDVGRGVRIPFVVDLTDIPKAVSQVEKHLQQLRKRVGALDLRLDGRKIEKVGKDAVRSVVRDFDKLQEKAKASQAAIKAIASATEKLRSGQRITKALVDQLTAISGVGPKTVQAINKYRDLKHEFDNIGTIASVAANKVSKLTTAMRAIHSERAVRGTALRTMKEIVPQATIDRLAKTRTELVKLRAEIQEVPQRMKLLADATKRLQRGEPALEGAKLTGIAAFASPQTVQAIITANQKMRELVETAQKLGKNEKLTAKQAEEWRDKKIEANAAQAKAIRLLDEEYAKQQKVFGGGIKANKEYAAKQREYNKGKEIVIRLLREEQIKQEQIAKTADPKRRAQLEREVVAAREKSIRLLKNAGIYNEKLLAETKQLLTIEASPVRTRAQRVMKEHTAGLAREQGALLQKYKLGIASQKELVRLYEVMFKLSKYVGTSNEKFLSLLQRVGQEAGLFTTKMSRGQRLVAEQTARTRKEYVDLFLKRKLGVITDRERVRLAQVLSELQTQHNLKSKKFAELQRQVGREAAKAAANLRKYQGSVMEGIKSVFNVRRAAWFVWLRLMWDVYRLIGKIKEEAYELDEAVARAMRTMTSATLDYGQVSSQVYSRVQKIAAATGAAYRDVGEALYQLSSAGLSAEEALSAVNSVMRVVRITEAEVTDTTKVIAGIFNVFRDQMKDAVDDTQAFSEIGAALTYVWKRNQIDMNEMVQALNQASQAAKLAGVEYQELIVLMGNLGTEMIRSGRAGRSFRSMVVQMAAKWPQLVRLFEMEEAFDPSKPLDFMNMLRLMHEQWVKMNKSALMTNKLWKIFGLRAGPAVVAMLENFEKIDKQMVGVNDQLGSMIEQFETQLRMQERYKRILEVTWKSLLKWSGITALLDIPKSLLLGIEHAYASRKAIIDMGNSIEQLRTVYKNTGEVTEAYTLAQARLNIITAEGSVANEENIKLWKDYVAFLKNAMEQYKALDKRAKESGEAEIKYVNNMTDARNALASELEKNLLVKGKIAVSEEKVAEHLKANIEALQTLKDRWYDVYRQGETNAEVLDGLTEGLEDQSEIVEKLAAAYTRLYNAQISTIEKRRDLEIAALEATQKAQEEYAEAIAKYTGLEENRAAQQMMFTKKTLLARRNAVYEELQLAKKRLAMFETEPAEIAGPEMHKHLTEAREAVEQYANELENLDGTIQNLQRSWWLLQKTIGASVKITRPLDLVEKETYERTLQITVLENQMAAMKRRQEQEKAVLSARVEAQSKYQSAVSGYRDEEIEAEDRMKELQEEAFQLDQKHLYEQLRMNERRIRNFTMLEKEIQNINPELAQQYRITANGLKIENEEINNQIKLNKLAIEGHRTAIVEIKDGMSRANAWKEVRKAMRAYYIERKEFERLVEPDPRKKLNIEDYKKLIDIIRGQVGIAIDKVKEYEKKLAEVFLVKGVKDPEIVKRLDEARGKADDLTKALTDAQNAYFDLLTARQQAEIESRQQFGVRMQRPYEVVSFGMEPIPTDQATDLEKQEQAMKKRQDFERSVVDSRLAMQEKYGVKFSWFKTQERVAEEESLRLTRERLELDREHLREKLASVNAQIVANDRIVDSVTSTEDQVNAANAKLAELYGKQADLQNDLSLNAMAYENAKQTFIDYNNEIIEGLVEQGNYLEGAQHLWATHGETVANYASQAVAAWKEMFAEWGKESKVAWDVYKGLAIAEVITSSTVAAWKGASALSEVPYIGPALAIAWVATVAAKAAFSIAQIQAQKPASYARGGVVDLIGADDRRARAASYATGGVTSGPAMAMIGDNKTGREIILPEENIKEDSVGPAYRRQKGEQPQYIVNLVTDTDVAAAMMRDPGKNVVINHIGRDMQQRKSTFREVRKTNRRR